MTTDVSRPHLSGKSISQVLKLPAGTQEDSKDHEADVDMEEKSGNSWYKEEAELPPSNPPVVYPALESPHSSRPHVGGKTLAHMPPAIEEDGEHGDQDADMGSTSDQVSDEEDNESTVSAGNNLRVCDINSRNNSFSSSSKSRMTLRAHCRVISNSKATMHMPPLSS